MVDEAISGRKTESPKSRLMKEEAKKVKVTGREEECKYVLFVRFCL